MPEINTILIVKGINSEEISHRETAEKDIRKQVTGQQRRERKLSPAQGSIG